MFLPSTHDPITPTSQSGTSSKYVVRAGDTLQSVAAAVWGDGAMWYLIAEANGLTASSELQVGVTLSIPAKVANIHNNVDTFRPYDPNQAIGDTNPSEPKPPTQKEAKCGIVGQILLVAIAVAVTVVTSGAAAAALGGVSGGVLGGLSAMTAGSIGLGATVAAGAIGAAVGSIASQAVGVATGIQDKFSWKGVAMSALAGGVSAGIGGSGLAKGLSAFTGGAVRGVAGSMITQGIGVATGLQDKFDWLGVATAGIVSGVSAQAGAWMGIEYASRNLESYAQQAVAGTVGAVAGAGLRSVVTGTNFGDNIMRALPDAIGATIGNMVAHGVQTKAPDRQEAERMEQMLEDSDQLTLPEASVPLIGPTNMDSLIKPLPTLNAAGVIEGASASGAMPLSSVEADLGILAAAFPGGAKVDLVSSMTGTAPVAPTRNQIHGLSLTLDEYKKAVEDGIWRTLEGASGSGITSDKGVKQATTALAKTPAVSGGDVEADVDLRFFMKEVAGITGKARISGDQKYEKILTFDRNGEGEIVVTALGLVGSQGGSFAPAPGSIAVAHFHYSGLTQPPNGADNSAVKVRNIPSFVVGVEAGTVWEVGRQSGEYMQRVIRSDGSASSWKKFRPEG